MTPDDITLTMLDAVRTSSSSTRDTYTTARDSSARSARLIADANRKAPTDRPGIPGGRRGSRNPPPPRRRPSDARPPTELHRRTRSRHSGSRRSGFAAMIHDASRRRLQNAETDMKQPSLRSGTKILIGRIVDTNSVSIADTSTRRASSSADLHRRRPRADSQRRPCARQSYRHHRRPRSLRTTSRKKTSPELFHSSMHRDRQVAARRMLAARAPTTTKLERSPGPRARRLRCSSTPHGTAPAWFERDGHVIVSLPGVPYEMEHPDAGRGDAAAEGALLPTADRPPDADYGRGCPESMLASGSRRGRMPCRPTRSWPTCPIRAPCGCACRPDEVEWARAPAREIERQFGGAPRRLIPTTSSATTAYHDAGARAPHLTERGKTSPRP